MIFIRPRKPQRTVNKILSAFFLAAHRSFWCRRRRRRFSRFYRRDYLFTFSWKIDHKMEKLNHSKYPQHYGVLAGSRKRNVPATPRCHSNCELATLAASTILNSIQFYIVSQFEQSTSTCQRGEYGYYSMFHIHHYPYQNALKFPFVVGYKSQTKLFFIQQSEVRRASVLEISTSRNAWPNDNAVLAFVRLCALDIWSAEITNQQEK